jgi:Mg/Co/Ni transporter MgtE
MQMPTIKSVASLRLIKREHANALLTLMPKTRAALLRVRLYHADTLIGAYIDSDIVTFHPEQRVSDALRLFRRDGQRTGHTIYVLDDQQHVTGLLQISDLLSASDHTLVKTIMSPVMKILHSRAPLQTVNSYQAWLVYDSLPVINRNGVFQGVLRRDNVIGETDYPANEVDFRDNADATRVALSDIFWIAIGALFAGGSGVNRGERD